MSIKGVCSIELRNEDGSLAQKTTDENMVTNFISNLINPDYDFFKGLFDKNVMKLDYALYPLIDKVIGGVFLFGETLPEDPDYRIPKAPLIGHASSTYQYNIPTAGLFNSNESTVLSDTEGNVKGFKYVWDFATDKANGTIKCVSLTTGKAGSKGFKYSSDSKIVNSLFTSPCKDTNNGHYSYYPLNVFQTSTGKYPFETDKETKGSYGYIYYGNSSYDSFLFDGNDIFILIANLEKDKYIFVTKISETSITLAKCELKRNIGLYEERDTLRERVEIVEETTIEFDMPVFKFPNTYTLNKILSKVYTDDESIYVSGNDDGNLYIYKIDQHTFSIVHKETAITDIDGVGYHYIYGNGSYQSYEGCVKYGGYYYTTRFWNSKDNTSYPYRTDFIRINEKDTSEFETISTLHASQSTSSSNYDYFTIFSLFDDLLYMVHNYYNKTFCYNKSGLLLNISANCIPMTFVNLNFPYLVGRYTYGSSKGISYGVCNQGLITIDNLSTPIIKNNTQTMKITYEITEE